MVIVESATAEKRTATITVMSRGGDERRYVLPTGAPRLVNSDAKCNTVMQNGTDVYPGEILTKIPRATTKTKDITGGLPRGVELIEARHPREKAVITEVDGPVLTVRL